MVTYICSRYSFSKEEAHKHIPKDEKILSYIDNGINHIIITQKNIRCKG